jgi:hypothetical protein
MYPVDMSHAENFYVRSQTDADFTYFYGTAGINSK